MMFNGLFFWLILLAAFYLACLLGKGNTAAQFAVARLVPIPEPATSSAKMANTEA